MTSDIDTLAPAECHVRNSEEHVAHLKARVAALDENDSFRGALLARQALKAAQQTLELECELLRAERRVRGLKP